MDKIHVIVAGNIGSGKSYLINKITWINDEDVYIMKEFLDYDPSLITKLCDKLEGRMDPVDFETNVVLTSYIYQMQTDAYKRARIIVWDQAPETIETVFIPFYDSTWKNNDERFKLIPHVDSSYAFVTNRMIKTIKPMMNTITFIDKPIQTLITNITLRNREGENYSFEDMRKYELLYRFWYEELKLRVSCEQKYFIVLEGAPCAGKTSFINTINLTNTYIIKEFTEFLPNGKELLMKYLNKELDYVDFQLNVVLKSFIDQVNSEDYKKATTIIWDRSIYSIIDQFSYIALKRGNITQAQLDTITDGVLQAIHTHVRCYPHYKLIELSGKNTMEIARNLFNGLNESSYIIYLNQNDDLLQKRIRARGNEFEINEYDTEYNRMFDICVRNTIKRFNSNYYVS